jgi:PPP family 3-phenylpropionic acid transporter
MWHSVPLTLFWFTYFGALGVFSPYFGLYLKENAALSGTELGVVLSMLPLVGIVAQPLWGQIADVTGARSRILAWLSLCSSLGYLALFWAKGFLAIIFWTAVLAAFTSPVMPITVSVSLAVLKHAGPHAFGFVRVWGTIGFLILVVAFPWILDWYQASREIALVPASASEPGLEIMFVAIAVLVWLASLFAFYLPRSGAVSIPAARGDWKLLMRNGAFLRFLLFSLVVYFFLTGPMWLFPVFVRSRGGDIETIRGMWILMLIVEIPLVLSTGSGLKRLSSRGLLAVGALAGGVRWIFCGLISDMYVLYAVQMLHGVTVVGLLLGGPLYLEGIVPERLRSTAQSVFSTVGAGLASIASNVGSGWLLEFAGADLLYLTTGIGSLILGCLTWWMLPQVYRRPENELEIVSSPDI